MAEVVADGTAPLVPHSLQLNNEVDDAAVAAGDTDVPDVEVAPVSSPLVEEVAEGESGDSSELPSAFFSSETFLAFSFFSVFPTTVEDAAVVMGGDDDCNVTGNVDVVVSGIGTTRRKRVV